MGRAGQVPLESPMILEVTNDHVALLNDTDLRTLVAYLCIRESGHATTGRPLPERQLTE